jgi:hypothetical protein
MRRHVRPIYHALNHVIVFRLLRPSLRIDALPDSPRKRELIRQYYALTEAIVSFRDILIGEELGRAAWPFVNAAAIYWAPPELDRESPPPLTFDRFVCSVFHVYLQILEYSPREILSLFGRAGLKHQAHPYFDEYATHTRRLHRTWFDAYLAKNGMSFRLPEEAPAGLMPRMELKLGSPEERLLDRAELKRLYRWYRRVFHGAFR